MTLAIDRVETGDYITNSMGLEAMRLAFEEAHENPTANHPRVRHYAYDDEGVSKRRFNVFSGLSEKRGYAGVRARIDPIGGVRDERMVQAGEIRGDESGPNRKLDVAYLLFDLGSTELASLQYGHLSHNQPTANKFDNAGANRTAVTTALGIDYLARGDSNKLGFLGSGNFAPAHLAMACEVRPQLETIEVYSPTKQHRESFAEVASNQLSREITPVSSAQAAVDEADIVLCCTNSSDPVFDGDWLSPGATVACIVAMEKHFGHKDEHFFAGEIDDRTIERSDIIACSSIEQAKRDEQKVLWEREQRGLIDWSDVSDLSELAAGAVPGRTDDGQIALFHNNAGQGVSDLAIAIEHHEAALNEGLGIELDLLGR